jgi:hypothetical protein
LYFSRTVNSLRKIPGFADNSNSRADMLHSSAEFPTMLNIMHRGGTGSPDRCSRTCQQRLFLEPIAAVHETDNHFYRNLNRCKSIISKTA